MLKAVGFDAAIIGWTCIPGPGEDVLIYDAQKCADILVERDDMSEADAWEFLHFNTFGAYVGPGTPVFMHANWEDQIEFSSSNG